MGIINIEIKARCTDPENAEFVLMRENAEFKGLDHQVDTYFNVPHGRLKLREGNIEHALIHYIREDRDGPKTSRVVLYRPQKDPALKEILEKSLGILTVVDKKRKIFFIDNVKFHIDRVKGLGDFVEIEAIDRDGITGQDRLKGQCDHFMEILGIRNEELVAVSYSDMLMKVTD